MPGRVTDLSIGGCFVQSDVLPVSNEAVEISLDADPEHPLSGNTVYTLSGLGFAVRFTNTDRQSRKRLERWLHD